MGRRSVRSARQGGGGEAAPREAQGGRGGGQRKEKSEGERGLEGNEWDSVVALLLSLHLTLNKLSDFIFYPLTSI